MRKDGSRRRDEPPPPWIALPDLSHEDPATQGVADAYVTLTFPPFWTGLSAGEKADYLDRWNASAEWRAAISERYDLDGLDLKPRPGRPKHGGSPTCRLDTRSPGGDFGSASGWEDATSDCPRRELASTLNPGAGCRICSRGWRIRDLILLDRERSAISPHGTFILRSPHSVGAPAICEAWPLARSVIGCEEGRGVGAGCFGRLFAKEESIRAAPSVSARQNRRDRGCVRRRRDRAAERRAGSAQDQAAFADS